MDENHITIRNYDSSDFNSYVELHSETEKRDQSGHYISKQRLAEDLGHPSFRPEKDLFVAEYSGSIIGYASVFIESSIKRAIMNCVVHPLHRKKGIATELFGHAVRHAKQSGSTLAQVCIPEINLVAKKMATKLGLRFIRQFFGMNLNLNQTNLPADIRSKYTIRSLKSNEADKLTDIQNRSFTDTWGFNPNTQIEIAYRINLSGCKLEDIIMAYLENKAVGYCWSRRIVNETLAENKIIGEIHMLGVDPVFRRQGIGRKVLLAGLEHLKSQDISIVTLTADGEEPASLALYESVGFEKSSRSEWYEIKLA